MLAPRTAEDTVFVLHAHQIYRIHVKKIGGLLVAVNISLLDDESHPLRIGPLNVHITGGQDQEVGLRILCRQRLDRLAFAAGGIGEVINQQRAGDLHLDRLCEGPARQAVAGAGRQREGGVIPG
ncbi:hypothetical protein ES703_85762 [subsurface metagenome]